MTPFLPMQPVIMDSSSARDFTPSPQEYDNLVQPIKMLQYPQADVDYVTKPNTDSQHIYYHQISLETISPRQNTKCFLKNRKYI